MNTRGLMEPVAISVVLDLGARSRTLFAKFVLMAVVATVATTPILQAVYRSSDLTGVQLSQGYDSDERATNAIAVPGVHT